MGLQHRRGRAVATVVAIAVVVMGALFAPAGDASPADEYTRAHFGARDIPPGCKHDSMLEDVETNVCHHIRTDMNGLDSPIIDVLIMVPASPLAEREVRTIRQAVEMWEGGIDYLAPQMGLDWLSEGTDFRIAVDTVDPRDDRFSVFPVVDPEIVVVSTNPVGGLGIGIDPVSDGPVQVAGLRESPCHGATGALLEFGFWQALPGFDDHHGKSGTYSEDCGGGGGNVCFAVNLGIDPAPVLKVDQWSFFDLVAHEVGHCLSVGHVGDGAEGGWGKLPRNDIMAYHAAPSERTKCVSTLDVEGFAPRMSRYIDVNGDGVVNPGDERHANDPIGDNLNPFQTQHPRDHFYASATGNPRHCPQPSTGVLPGPRTDWTPHPIATGRRVLDITSPSPGAHTRDPSFTVAGTVETDRPTTEAAPAPAAGEAPPHVPDNGAEVTTITPSTTPQTVAFQHADGNSFVLQDSTLGLLAGGHDFALALTTPANVSFTLSWSDENGQSDLDLIITGAADAGAAASTARNPEKVSFAGVHGRLNITVDPYLVLSLGDVPYTLSAVVTSGGDVRAGLPDRDGDDTPDESDACVDLAGDGADGCPMPASERVLVYVDDATRPAGSTDVDTTQGRDGFRFPVWVPKGSHTLRVVWESTSGKVYAVRSLTVTRD